MPVNWTSGKRQLAKTKLQSRTKPNETKNKNVPHKNIDRSIPAENLFSNFTFASHINRPLPRSRGFLEERIISEPSSSTQPARTANSTVHTSSVISHQHLTNAEKRDSLLKMESWTWLLRSNHDSGQDKIENGVISHHLSRYSGDHGAKADMKEMGYQHDGLELSLPVSSPGIREGNPTRNISGSYFFLSNKTDSQSENESASSTIEESERSQSAGHGIPPKIISYKEMGHDSYLREPTPNAQEPVKDIVEESPESPLKVKGMPTSEHTFQTVPSLMKSIEGSRRQLPKVTSDVITGVKNQSKKSYELKRHLPKTHRKISSSSERSTSSDDFSDILAAASNAAKRRKVIVGQTSTFFDTNTSHSGGTFTKRTISTSDTMPERNFFSSDGGSSSQLSNLELFSSLNSPSHRKEPIRTESKAISTRSSDLDYQNDSMILQPSDFGVTTSQDDIIEFSDSGLNSTSLMVAEDLENSLQEINSNVKRESSGEESEEVPKTPEWLKRMSLSLGFSPPKMSRLLRK